MGKNETGKKSILLTIIKKFLPFIGLAIFFYLIYDIGLNKVVDTFLSISPIYIFVAAA